MWGGTAEEVDVAVDGRGQRVREPGGGCPMMRVVPPRRSTRRHDVNDERNE
jgi:hypothetical protein